MRPARQTVVCCERACREGIVMADFDVECFIEAVKDRPALWDVSLDDYSNRSLKKQLWEEVTFLFGGSECSTQKEITALSLNLQKKWRNLKDSFGREKRRLSGVKTGSAADRKSQYVYYHILSFLNKGHLPANTQSSMTKDTEDSHFSGCDSPTGSYQPTMKKKKKKTEDDVGTQSGNFLKSSSGLRKKLDEEVLQDEDKMFLMSLVTDFKSIPQERKLSAKRQILTVIEQHILGNVFQFDHLDHNPNS